MNRGRGSSYAARGRGGYSRGGRGGRGSTATTNKGLFVDRTWHCTYMQLLHLLPGTLPFFFSGGSPGSFCPNVYRFFFFLSLP